MSTLDSIVKFKALSIKPGSVFKMTFYPEDGIVPKNVGDKSRDKYFAIIGIDQDSVLVGSVLINTEINPKMFMKIATLQHRILPDDYDFLGGKERYIDCSSLFEIKYDRALYDADYIGILKEDDLSEIIRLTLTSPFIKKGKLKKYMNVE